MLKNKLLLFYIILILMSSSVFGLILNPFNNYQTASMVEHAPSLFFNPAGIALIDDFNIYFNISDVDGKNRNSSMAFSFFLGGFGYEAYDINNKSYKVYNLTLPGSFNFFGYNIYFGMAHKWYSINRYDPYTFDLGFLYRFYNHFSLGLVFNNLAKKNIYYDTDKDIIQRKYSLGMALWKNRIKVGMENIHREKFDINKNVFQASFEPLLGLIFEFTYFDIPSDRKLFSGIKLQFPNFGFKYYNSDKIAHNNNYEFSLHSKNYKTFFCVPNKITEIKISGLLTDAEQYSFLGDISSGAQRILENLNKCYEDDSIKGIVLRIGSIQTTSYGGIGGLVYEIREKIMRLRGRGKYIVAYMETGGSTEEYYLASAAHSIVLSPYATVEELGIAVKVLKLKGLLDRFGISFEVIQSGKSKNSLNPFTEEMKKEDLAKIEESVESAFNLFVLTISQDRFIDQTDIINLIEEYPILDAEVLKTNNWIDKIGYKEKAYDEMARLLERKHIYGLEKVNIASIQYIKKEWREGPIIAIISIHGPIITGESIYNPIYGNLATGSESIINQLKDAEGNPHIKGVILRIDSPGGSVVASDAIYEQVIKLKKSGKYVIASLGSMAASGGYYIACAADYIISTPYTITGSIGVFSMKLDLSGLFKKFDITTQTVKKGPYSDSFSYDRKLTKEERKKMQKSLDRIHNRFKTIVHKNREIEYEELDKLADGRIFIGQQAKAHKLVDEVGGITEAIEQIKLRYDIDDPYYIYYWKNMKSSSPIRLGTSILHF